MGLRTIIRMGHPNLRRIAQPVELDDIGSDKMNTLLRDMEEPCTTRGASVSQHRKLMWICAWLLLKSPAARHATVTLKPCR